MTPTPKNDASFLTYLAGFLLSVALTLAAYFTVTGNILSAGGTTAIILSLAVLQLLVQLVFFLHLGDEQRPRFNLTVFLFMMVVLVIVVFGSLWIMNNLNYHMMPAEVDKYIQEEEGIHHKSH